MLDCKNFFQMSFPKIKKSKTYNLSFLNIEIMSIDFRLMYFVKLQYFGKKHFQEL